MLVIATKGINPLNKLETGNTLETRSRNPAKYNTGNFTISIKTSFVLFFFENAALKKPAVNSKLATDQILPIRKPAAHKGLPHKIRITHAVRTKTAVSFKDFFSVSSINRLYLF